MSLQLAVGRELKLGSCCDHIPSCLTVLVPRLPLPPLLPLSRPACQKLVPPSAYGPAAVCTLLPLPNSQSPPEAARLPDCGNDIPYKKTIQFSQSITHLASSPEQEFKKTELSHIGSRYRDTSPVQNANDFQVQNVAKPSPMAGSGSCRRAERVHRLSSAMVRHL